jgi:hypothetical protein
VGTTASTVNGTVLVAGGGGVAVRPAAVGAMVGVAGIGAHAPSTAAKVNRAMIDKMGFFKSLSFFRPFL